MKDEEGEEDNKDGQDNAVSAGQGVLGSPPPPRPQAKADAVVEENKVCTTHSPP